MDSYHSLVAWQQAHAFAIRTLRGIDDSWTPRAGAMLEQLRKAVISIEANIVEGYALNTNGYMLKHYRIAFGSAAEAEVLLGDGKSHKNVGKGPTHHTHAPRPTHHAPSLAQRPDQPAGPPRTTHHAPRTVSSDEPGARGTD